MRSEIVDPDQRGSIVIDYSYLNTSLNLFHTLTLTKINRGCSAMP